jgi:hypothetical protein
MAKWRILAAAFSAFVSAAVGVVTNVVTSSWSITLLALLGALVLLNVVLQIAVTGADGTPAAGAQVAKASGRARIVQAGRDVVLTRRSVDEDDGPDGRG